MTEIRPLDLQDLPLIKTYLRLYPPQVSELTFTNLFVWRAARPICVAEEEDTCIILADFREDGWWGFGPPMGKLSSLEAVRGLGMDIKGFTRIPEDTANTLREEGLSIIPDRDNADYVYRVSDLANLAGAKYHKKRNLVKQCLEKYQCQYEEITLKNIPECMEMQNQWCTLRECGHDPVLCHEYNAIRDTFTYFELFNLIGGAIRVNGVIKAYALGEELAPDTAVWHFEKAMPEIQGLSQLVNQWFSLHSLQGFEFVNREQDLGIPGLRQAKSSYYPHHMVEKFTAIMTSAGMSGVPRPDPKECDRHSKVEE
jgi:uncharacterized protein